MKTLFTFLIFNLSFLIFNSNAQWVELDPGVDETLFDIYAITPDIAVAVGFNGTIIKTIDGGETWQQKDSGTTKTLKKVQFLNSTVGVVISGKGTVLKTTDSGETWVSFNIEEDPFLSNLSIVNENLIFTCGHNGIYKTINGGETWSKVSTLWTEWIQFTDDEIGYTIDTGDLFKTYNGGETWEEINNSLATTQFLDENTGFYYFDGLYKTIDGGYNFELLGYGQGQAFSNIYVVDENNTWGTIIGLLNGDGTTRGIVKVHILTDGTYTEDIWFDDDPTLDMASIHFANENTGYIVGYKDWKTRIWKNGTGINTMSMVEPTINEIKVYPNPASNVINIDLGKMVSDFNISLNDLSGKQLIYQNYKDKDKISVNTEKLSKGIYILSIQTNQQKLNRKIIIR